MDRRVGVPVVLLALTDVLQIANALLAFLRQLVHGAVDVLARRQRAAVRATTCPVTHNSVEHATVRVSHHVCHERRRFFRAKSTERYFKAFIDFFFFYENNRARSTVHRPVQNARAASRNYTLFVMAVVGPALFREIVTPTTTLVTANPRHLTPEEVFTRTRGFPHNPKTFVIAVINLDSVITMRQRTKQTRRRRKIAIDSIVDPSIAPSDTRGLIYSTYSLLYARDFASPTFGSPRSNRARFSLLGRAPERLFP